MVEKSSKLPLINLGEYIEERVEQVGDNQVAIQEAREIPTNKG